MSSIAIQAFGTKLQRGADGAGVGSGYTNGDALIFTGGGGTLAAGHINVTTGNITSATVTTPGSGYTSAPTVTVTTAGGAGQQLTAHLSSGTVGTVTVSQAMTTIAEVKSLTWNMSAKQDDVTTHSTGTPWREYISSLLDAGTITFSINFLPTEDTHDYDTGVLQDFRLRTKRNYSWIFPDAANTTWLFAATVQDFKPSAAVDGPLEASLTLKLSGVPTFA